jgi:hypothetical protein
MKTIRSKLWSVASGNQTVSGGGRDQNQSIPDFVRGYNEPLGDYKAALCLPLLQTVLNKKIFKHLAMFL